MIRIWKNIIGSGLFWTDIFFIGIHFIIGLTFLYLTFYYKDYTVANFTALNVPVEDYKDQLKVLSWVLTLKDTELLKIVGKTWLYACLTGFFGILSLITLHEALIRLRIRLG